MPVNPLCLVADGLGPFVPTSGGVNVAQGDTISIKLADTTNVAQWFLQISGTDELTTAPSLTNVNPITNQVTAPSSVVTFVFPNAKGRAILFTSTVTGPGGPVTTTFTIYTLTLINRRVGAAGEEREGNTNYGWITIVNPMIRSGGSVLFYDDTLAGPATGSSTLQGAIDYLKANSGGFTAGGDLSGTSTNQTVIRIQTRPVSAAPPAIGQFLGWTGTLWAPSIVTSVNNMPFPATGTAHHQDFLRITANPFLDTSGAIWDGSNLWVGNNGFSQALKIDTSTNPPTLVSKFAIPTTGTDTGANVHAVDGTHVFVAPGVVGGALYLINKTTGAIQGKIVGGATPTPPNFTGIFSVAVNGDDIYVASGISTNSAQIDRYSKSATLAAYPSPGTSVATLPPQDASGIGRLVFGGGFLFSDTDNPTLSGSTLRKHNAATLAILDSFHSSNTNDFFGGLVYAFGSVWLARSGGVANAVQRFDPTNLVAGPSASVAFPAGTSPQWLTSDLTTIWSTVTGFDDALIRISTGVGTEAIIAALPTKAAENLAQIAFDGTYIWVPVNSFTGTGPNQGLRNASTGLGTEAFVSFWTGPILLEYDPSISPTSDLGYLLGDPSTRVTGIQQMPVGTENFLALPGSTFTTVATGNLGAPSGIAQDPFSFTLWVGDPSAFPPGVGQAGALIRIDSPSGAYPQGQFVPLALPTGPFTALTPGRLAIDASHVFFTTGAQELVGLVDKTSNQLVALCFTGVSKQAMDVEVNGDDIYVIATNPLGSSEVQKFSKSAALAAYPAQVTPTASVAAPIGTVRFNRLSFGGGFIFATGIQTGPIAQLFKIDPTGPMSITQTWTGGSSDSLGCHFAFTSVWVTTGVTKSVLRFDPTNITAGPIATVTTPLMGSALGITADATTILVGDGNPGAGLSLVHRISTGLGTEAITASVKGNTTDPLDDLTIDVNSDLWAADTFSALQRFSIATLGSESFDLLWKGPLALNYNYGLSGVTAPGGAPTMVGGSTLSNFDRYVIYGGPGAGSDGDTIFLPKNPQFQGQQHTIVFIGNGKGQLHGNGSNIDGLPSLSFSTKSDASSWTDTIDASITVSWTGTAWKVDSYGGSNPMLWGDLTGKERRNRLRHIGSVGVPDLPIANLPGSSLGIGVGSSPTVIIANNAGLVGINRTGSNDFVRYDPTANPPVFAGNFVIRLPEKWVCTNAISIVGGPWAADLLVGDKNSGRLAILEYPDGGDEPGIGQLYNLPYISVDVLLQSPTDTTLFYVSGGTANFLATFNIVTERITELAGTRGYNSLVDGGNGFLYGTPSDGSGTIHKINPLTGAIVLTVLCPDGATSGLTIGCKYTAGPTKLILINHVNQHYYSFNVPSDTFDGVNFNLSATFTNITGVATNNTDLAFIGTGASGGKIAQVTSPVTSPVLGTVISLPFTANLTGVVYRADAAPAASYIITDGGRDLTLHVESATFTLSLEVNVAGILTVLSPPPVGDNGNAYLMGPNRPFLENIQWTGLQVLNTGLTDGATVAGSDIVMADNRLVFAGFTGGKEGQVFSFEPGGFVQHQEADLTATQVGFTSPSAIVGVGVAFDFFNILSVSSTGVISSFIYETVYNGAIDNHQISNTSGENWAESRAAYVFLDTNGFTGVEGTFFWTAPAVHKVYCNTFFANGQHLVLNLPGESPTGICGDAQNNLWISFPGAGLIRKYTVGQTNTDYFVVTEVLSFPASNVIEMISDGKYLWGLSTDGLHGTLYKFNMSGVLLGSYVFPDGTVNTKARMAFDGHAIWVTHGQTLSAFPGEGPLIDIQSENAYLDLRGITIDREDGTIYIAEYNNVGGTSLKIIGIFRSKGSGAYPPVRERVITWQTGPLQGGAATTIPLANFPVIPGQAPSFGIEVEITATAFAGGSGVAYWKRACLVNYSAGNLVLVGAVSDVIPPKMDTNATTEGWDVTFTDGTPLFNISVTQGTHVGRVMWTARLRHIHGPYGGF